MVFRPLLAALGGQMDFSVPEHTHYFSGYLDAVSRWRTTDSVLCSMWAEIIPDRTTFRENMDALIKGEQIVEKPSRHFNQAIAEFLDSDTRNRLLFYLLDYWDWFIEFSENIECYELDVEFNQATLKHRVFALEVDSKYTILVVLMAIEKLAPPNKLNQSGLLYE